MKTQAAPHREHFHYYDPATKGRIDQFLANKLPAYSRTAIREIIEKGHVTSNERVVTKAGHWLKDGDAIIVNFPTPAPKLAEKNVAHDIDLTVVGEEKDFLIINKPAGLLVHHAPSSSDAFSVVNGLLYRYQDFDSFEDQVRPGIVHRLDKNTSGLLLIAKNPQAQRIISDQFKNREIQKTYLAVVEGHPSRSGAITFPIGRHPSKRHMMSHQGIQKRDAYTDYTVIAFYKDTSLVAFKPITGRTHQIRVHAAAIGHPIVGDEVYGKKSALIERQALHAWKLSFTYDGKAYEYRASLPQDMKTLIGCLKS